jgi:hypothetical protein
VIKKINTSAVTTLRFNKSTTLQRMTVHTLRYVLFFFDLKTMLYLNADRRNIYMKQDESTYSILDNYVKNTYDSDTQGATRGTQMLHLTVLLEAWDEVFGKDKAVEELQQALLALKLKQ